MGGDMWMPSVLRAASQRAVLLSQASLLWANAEPRCTRLVAI